jgi:GPH family glycoside/pentoside/hexuronide:cation symporter
MYYFKYFVENVGIAALFMVLGLMASMLGAALTGPLTSRFGQRAVMNACLIIGIVSSALLFLPGPKAIVAIFALSIVVEFSTGPVVALFFAMLGDAADYSEWRTHRRATALTFSAGTLSMKVGTAIAASVSGWLLAWFGYIANVEQTASALLGIRLLFTLIPAGVALLLFVVFQFYPLSGEVLQKVELDLNARRQAS